MPLLILLSLGVTIACCVHAMRNGRPYWWLFVLIGTSWIGAAIYPLVEVLPEMRRSRAARSLKTEVARLVDPQRDFREAAQRLEDHESVETLTAMAEQLAVRERYGEAATMLERCLHGPHEHDPGTLLRLAEARFLDGDPAGALTALDTLQEHNPGYHSEPGHLLYGRSQEALGLQEDALESYADLAGYATSEEPRVRLGLLLQKTGRTVEARAAFETVVRNLERASKVHFRNEREWYQAAKANL